jgi:hypothetical protein
MILLRLDNESLYNLLLADDDMKKLAENHPTFYIDWTKKQYIDNVEKNRTFQILKDIIMNNEFKQGFFAFVFVGYWSPGLSDKQFLKVFEIILSDKKFATLRINATNNLDEILNPIASQENYDIFRQLCQYVPFKKMLREITYLEHENRQKLSSEILKYYDLSLLELYKAKRSFRGWYDILEKIRTLDNKAEQFIQLKTKLTTKYKNMNGYDSFVDFFMEYYDYDFKNSSAILKKLLPSMTFEETFLMASKSRSKAIWEDIYKYMDKTYDLDKEIANFKNVRSYSKFFELKKRYENKK